MTNQWQECQSSFRRHCSECSECAVCSGRPTCRLGLASVLRGRVRKPSVTIRIVGVRRQCGTNGGHEGRAGQNRDRIGTRSGQLGPSLRHAGTTTH